MSVKAERKYVGEIDTSFQWVPAFQIGTSLKCGCTGLNIKKLQGALLPKKTPKSFMILGPGVDFINIQGAAFACSDPEKAKETDN